MSKAVFIIIFLIQSNWVLSQVRHADEPCELCKQKPHVGSPYEINFKHEIPFLAVGVALSATGIVMNESSMNLPISVEELAALNPLDVNGFDRGAIDNYSQIAASYSDFFRTGVSFFPIYFLTNFHTKGDAGTLLLLTGEVFLTTFGLTQIAKNTLRRPRPYLYNPEVPAEDKTSKNGTRSFFSGHTSHTAAFSFFMAKVISDYHPNASRGAKAVLWTSAAAIPALTGYLRVKSGKHFPTDVIVGYAVGAAVGVLIPHWHKKKDRERSTSFFPLISPGYSGIAIIVPLGQKKSLSK